MTRAALLLFTGLCAGQTRPRPEQIRNAQQVRICNNPPDCVDPRPGTLVLATQLQDGRFVFPTPSYPILPIPFAGTPDEGKRTVCVITFTGINLAAGGYVQQGAVCYTQYGLAQLLMDPAWLAWWNAQP